MLSFFRAICTVVDDSVDFYANNCKGFSANKRLIFHKWNLGIYCGLILINVRICFAKWWPQTDQNFELSSLDFFLMQTRWLA
jgi:hypothetical protein